MRTFTLFFVFLFCSLFMAGQTTRIITDFGGYWSSTTALPNAVRPDTSHMLLGFTHNGITYSTGVNDGVLTNNSVTYTPGDWRAFPVADILGNYGTGAGGGISCYIALANKVDRSPSTGNVPAVSNYSIKNALIDGIRGLDLGTGVTNLPTTAIMNFKIFGIDPTKIDDEEPDILLTQIADPSTSQNDIFSLRDAAGAQVGNTFTQDMTTLSSFGTYTLDLFNLTPSTPYNAATVYSIFQAHNDPVGTVRTRPIRVVAIKLSAFGITAANVGQVAALRIAPSGISDYAFIAYNANSISLSPNISQNPPLTNTSICDNGTAHFSVVATAAEGGSLSYSWEESTDGASTWHPVADGGNYAGAATNRLAVTDPGDGYRYKVTVTEAGNPNTVTSEVFQVTVISNPTAPTAVNISGGGTVCRGVPIQLTSTVTGGTNLYYQWESDPAGTNNFLSVPDANLSTYVPPADLIGAVSYRLRISSGSACIPSLTSPTQVITINGISSTSSDERCEAGTVNLNAVANSGTINWYTADVGGTAVATGPSYSPTLSGSTTYYVATSTCASASRVPVTATIFPASAGGTVNGSAAVPPGTNTTTLTLASNTGNVLKWQSSTDEFNAAITDIPNTTTQLTVTNLTQTTKYRAAVQSGSCAMTFSAPATITMSGTLPVDNTSIKVSKQEESIRLTWTAYDQENTRQFVVEKSADGITFTSVATLLPVTNGGSRVDYQWLDLHPFRGNNYYRLKEVLISGHTAYSKIVSITFEARTQNIVLYPNPVVNDKVQLQFNKLPAGQYRIRLLSTSAQAIKQWTIVHAGGTTTHTIRLPQHLPGLYKLETAGPGGFKQNHSLLAR